MSYGIVADSHPPHPLASLSPMGLISQHANWLPSGLQEHEVSLGEGGTPLLPLQRLAAAEEVEIELWAKYEGQNPTGSFKDRGMAVAVAHALAEGQTSLLCASTGNTSASAAAYAARAGLPCRVILPAGKVAAGKLVQAIALGARIISISGGFDDAMRAVRELGGGLVAVVNSTNPYRLQGQKTVAFEVIDELGFVPDVHALPVGNAGNITAHWMGYCEAAGIATEACSFCQGKCSLLNKNNLNTDSTPELLGVQAEGAAPFVVGEPIEEPQTVASAIRIGNPQSWDAARIAIRDSGGRMIAVSDPELLRVRAALAAKEGIFCEPASAAGLAGVLAEAKAGRIVAGARVVCTLTGTGLKDQESVDRTGMIIETASDCASIARCLDLA